ncbi:MAG: periplasmic heavy metal sensor, partial [Pseudomonadota bacterium]
MNWRNALLFGSLALNVFILGTLVGGSFVGARVVHPEKYDRMVASADIGAPPIDPRIVMQSLEPDRRRELTKTARTSIRKLGPQMRDLRQSRQAFIEALTAEPFDEAAARSAFGTLRETDMTLRGRGYDSVFELVLELTPEERKRVGEA